MRNMSSDDARIATRTDTRPSGPPTYRNLPMHTTLGRVPHDGTSSRNDYIPWQHDMLRRMHR